MLRNVRCTCSQGDDHNIWGNAPKKSNSATCAHFYKRTRYTSKPDIFLIFRISGGVKIVFFMFLCKSYKKLTKIIKNNKNYKKL